MYILSCLYIKSGCGKFIKFCLDNGCKADYNWFDNLIKSNKRYV